MTGSPSCWRTEQRVLDRHVSVALTFTGQDPPTGAFDDLSQKTLGVGTVGSGLLWDHLAVIAIDFLDIRGEKHSATESYALAQEAE